MNDEQKVRLDLIDNSGLLNLLGSLIKVKDYSRDFKGIVFAAPHNAKSKGTLSSGHDITTGYIAEELAKKFNAKCVIGTEIRTFIDLNKSPWKFDDKNEAISSITKTRRKADKLMKQFYQSQIFHDNPKLIVEIHGHISGYYDIEIASGFELSPVLKRDDIYLKILKNFKKCLFNQFKKSWKHKKIFPTIGVSPIDDDVYFKATSTYTFEKVEKLRELGVNIFGLHIEIHKALRPSAKSAITNDLINILYFAMNDSIFDLMEVKKEYDLKEKLYNDFINLNLGFSPIVEAPFTVFKVPREYSNKNVIILSSYDIKKLKIKGEEEILISDSLKPGNVIQAFAVKGSCRRGSILINKKMRNDLSIDTADSVYISKKPSSELQKRGALCYVSSITDKKYDHSILVSKEESENIKNIRIIKNGIVNLLTRHGKNKDVRVKKSSKLCGSEISITLPVARRNEITYGDLVCLREPISFRKFVE